MFSAAEANAQESLGGFALNQFDPSPAGDDFFSVPSAHTDGHLVPRAYFMYDHAFDPLVAGDGAIVSHQGFLRANGSITFFKRLLIGVDVPVAIVQSGDDPQVGTVTIASPDSVEMGDVRLDIRGSLYGQYRDPVQVGLGARFYFATAGEDSLAGEGKPRVQPQAAISGRVGEEHAFLYTASFGWMARGPENPHTLTFGAGVGGTFFDDIFQVQAELFGNHLVGDDPPISTPNISVVAPTRTSLELLGGAKLRVLGGLTFGVAAGPGLTDGIGTPTARVLGMIGWAPIPERDRSGEDDDADGITNGVDACPTVKGVENDDPKRNGCAPPDRDEDKIPDALDACPSIKGRPNADETRNGCPADYDRDGVADAEDACPNQRGVASSDPKRHGCPGEVDTDLDGIADRSDACPNVKGSRSDDPSKNGCPAPDGDKDGIADVDDACPSERGFPNPDKAHHGCPKEVRVTSGEIVILRQVRFKFGQSALDQTVDPVSDDLLTEVRDVIQEHPEIETIEVQGHADDMGTADFNKTLSQQRAEAVRRWLTTRGIDPKRLVAKGYGSTVPVASNTTDEGRQRNRRVQFVIIKKK
ncbi:MAG: OmpA family protein [Polyangiaceae bacterium]|nr:OmpA family protein [Polyangiaceae bacterium]